MTRRAALVANADKPPWSGWYVHFGSLECPEVALLLADRSEGIRCEIA